MQQSVKHECKNNYWSESISSSAVGYLVIACSVVFINLLYFTRVNESDGLEPQRTGKRYKVFR